MPERTGVERPGGRTARTRGAVLAATRELLASGEEPTIAEVAARSGVHATTIYRRWRTVESLVLDVAVEDVTAESPVPATGDLEADLRRYVRGLLTAIRDRGQLRLFQALQSAARHAASAEELQAVVGPRVAQFQAMLDAAGVTRIDGIRLVELIIAPAYFRAQVGAPFDPDHDTDRLVGTALLAARETP
jgi:AcrR family transcriptional regulator